MAAFPPSLIHPVSISEASEGERGYLDKIAYDDVSKEPKQRSKNDFVENK